ncbi:kinase, partial [Thraustotheca clavata]
HSLKPALIHRNIKASKVLLTKGLVPKLSGFEKSRDRTLLEDMTTGVGDIRWSAPELLLDEEMYDEKIDVYSFGVLLTELDTGEFPFAKEEAAMRKNELQGKLMTGALLPKCSASCPKSILRIFRMCIQHDPSLRPTSRKLLELLEAAKNELRQA